MSLGMWLYGLGGIILLVVGVMLLQQGGAAGLLGAIAIALGVAGIVVLLLRRVGDDGPASTDRPAKAGRAFAFLGHDFLGHDFLGMRDMSTMGQWAAGIAMGVLALLGLFLISRSGDGMFTVFGSLLFFFGIAAIVVLVHRATDYSATAADDDQHAT